MTPHEYENNELEKDLNSNEPEILRNDIPFRDEQFDSDNCMYEGLALGNNNPFFGD